ncbi:unnamed protein product [Mortierella alpina]
MAIDFHFQSLTDSSNALLVGKIATVASIGIYAGTALTFNTIIMPSLRKFSTSSSIAIWNETAVAAKNFQISSVLISVAGSTGLYYKTKNPSYLYAAVTMASLIPYNLLALVPINRKLFAIRESNTVNGRSNSMKDSVSDDSVAEALLSRWNLFQYGRTLLGFGALIAALYGVASDSSVRFILFK